MAGQVIRLRAEQVAQIENRAQHELLLDGSQGLNSPKDEQAWMILSFMYSLSRYPYARRMMLRA